MGASHFSRCEISRAPCWKAEKSRTALRTVEGSSYAYFGVLSQPQSACKVIQGIGQLAFDTVEVWVRVPTGLPYLSMA